MTAGSKAFHARTSLPDDIGQQGGSNLFGLEMTSLDEKNIGMAEPTVIVHFARKVCIGTKGLGFGNKVAARTST